MMRSDSLRAKRAGFTSQHDTLMASVVKTSKQGMRAVKPIERPANTAYTVQVGAFARTDHALRAQKLARERFAEIPIFNTFEPYDKTAKKKPEEPVADTSDSASEKDSN